MKCVGALLARDEAGEDRYLKRALANAALFCDAIVVLDDGSSDTTRDVALAADKVVRVESTYALNGWWAAEHEGTAREKLWNLACKEAGPDGWVYVFDSDHELIGIEPDNFRLLLRAEGATAWACPLYDCWDDDQHHRVDGYWQAWLHPRPWLARSTPHLGSWGPLRGIHAGHLPPVQYTVGLMPPGAAIRHLGYIKEAHRVAKCKKYVSLNT
jgi:hypothetical protein